MPKLKHCPFCGGFIRINRIIENINYIETEAECGMCNVVFQHIQEFSVQHSKSGRNRVSLNDSFEEVFNRRCGND